MSTTAVINEKKFVAALRRSGFVYIKKRGKGSHHYWKHPDGRWIMYSNKLSKPMLQRLCIDNNLLTPEERKFFNITLKKEV